jgi:DNA repair photolyase
MFCKPIGLSLSNYITETIKVTEDRTLARPTLEYRGCYNVCIFCDLTKAFDYVNHNVLLSKLEFYGIKGRANNLIKSYLSDRYQRGLIKNNCSNECFSDWDKNKQGVRKGSILGPLFFFTVQ